MYTQKKNLLENRNMHSKAAGDTCVDKDIYIWYLARVQNLCY